jgi:hypothetical protein
MPTPASVMDIAASALNDTAQETYNDDVLIPYYNMALRDLQMKLEEAGIPVTQKVSTDIAMVAGTTVLSFTTTPALPSDLIELDQIWETNDGGLSWTPLQRKDYIDPNLSQNQLLSVFGIYVWNENELIFPQATADITLRLHYIRRIAEPITIDDIDDDIVIINSDMYLGFKTAAYAALLVNQDTERGQICEMQAERSLETQMNISTKAQQAIVTRRRPFRSSYKNYGRSW